MALLLSVDQHPWRGVDVGLLEHIVHRVHVEVPGLAVAPVVGGQLVALERVRAPLLEAAQLLLPGDVQPELDDDGAPVVVEALELADLAVGPLPVGARCQALDALDEHAAVPGAVEDGDAPAPGHARVEALHVVPQQLQRRGRTDRVHAHPARIEVSGEARDRASLAPGVDALDDDHRSRALLVVHPHLQPQQLKLQPLELLVVLDPLDPQRRVEVGDTRRAAV